MGRGRGGPAPWPQTQQGRVPKPCPSTAGPAFISLFLTPDMKQDAWQVPLDPQLEAGGLEGRFPELSQCSRG